MQGRYGVDDFSRFIMGVALTLIILTMVVTMFNRNVGSILDFLGIAAIVYAYFRIFSRNIQQRYAENQKYLALENRLRRFFGQKRYLMQQRKEYHIYKCPGCKQKIRIPRGKGKISIRCPKCGEEFIKNS